MPEFARAVETYSYTLVNWMATKVAVAIIVVKVVEELAAIKLQDIVVNHHS